MLTERQFARRAGLSVESVRRHRCIPRIGSRLGLGSAYPAFMLDDHGLRVDVAFVALLLRRRVDDLDACDWLVRPTPALADVSPLVWIGDGQSMERVLAALPKPTKTLPAGQERSTEADAIREEWLRFRGDEETPGWTIAWDRLARRTAATPHGI